MRMRESGILDHLSKQLKKNVDKCKIKNLDKKSSTGYPLNLYAIVCAFFVFGLGVGLSLIAFVMELIIHHSLNRKRVQRQKNAPIPLFNELTIPNVLVYQIKTLIYK